MQLNVPHVNKLLPAKARTPGKTDEEIKQEERETRYKYYLKHSSEDVLCSCGHQYNRARRYKHLITEKHLDHIIKLIGDYGEDIPEERLRMKMARRPDGGEEEPMYNCICGGFYRESEKDKHLISNRHRESLPRYRGAIHG